MGKLLCEEAYYADEKGPRWVSLGDAAVAAVAARGSLDDLGFLMWLGVVGHNSLFAAPFERS